MNNSELFIEKFKTLEKVTVARFGMEADGRAIYNLERMPAFKNQRTLIAYCRDVRNLLQHNPKIDGEDAVQPSDKIIEFLDSLIERIEKPEHCMKYALQIKNLYYRGTSDLIYPPMEVMEKRHFSHVPILEAGRVVGVFSRDAIFKLILDGKTTEDLKTLKFSDIADYIRMHDKRSEVYVFIKEDTLVEEAELTCEEYYRNKERVGMFFITKNGKANEKLLGAITPWTILGQKD